MGWLDEREQLPCDICKKMHQKKGNVPPCSTCMPPLLPENADAVNVYVVVRNQVVTVGMGDVVDLHFPSVKLVMDMIGVIDQKRCFEKVLRIFHEKLQVQRLQNQHRSKER